MIIFTLGRIFDIGTPHFGEVRLSENWEALSENFMGSNDGFYVKMATQSTQYKTTHLEVGHRGVLQSRCSQKNTARCTP